MNLRSNNENCSLRNNSGQQYEQNNENYMNEALSGTLKDKQNNLQDSIMKKMFSYGGNNASDKKVNKQDGNQSENEYQTVTGLSQ